MWRFPLVLFYFCHSVAAFAYSKPSLPTKGEVWPLPQSVQYQNGTHFLNPSNFNIVTSVKGCDVIDPAFDRYTKFIFKGINNTIYSTPATLTTLQVFIDEKCDNGYPFYGMDESYSLTVSNTSSIAVLNSKTVWGMLRGLETFSQLVYLENDQIHLRPGSISDHPRFPHRGVMIDSARHFLGMGVLLKNLDIMAQNKMNVLHWHLVDSESFPYTSLRYPEMIKGAYTPNHIYTRDNIKQVIEYARLRDIRVIPEFDTVGHAGAWGAGRPDLLSKCYGTNGEIIELPNIMDPSKNSTMQFVKGFFEEVRDTFPDKFVHFGGDEVAYDMHHCWALNPEVSKRITQMGFASTYDLLRYYYNQLFSHLDSYKDGTSKIIWQDVIELGVKPKNTIVHVWKGTTRENQYSMIESMVKQGHNVIFSSCWYLNYIRYGADWGYVNGTNKAQQGEYYQCDPTDFKGTEAEKKLVVGGEAAIWGEFVDSTNLITRLWPRTSAIAERLWSDKKQTNSADKAWPRLHEMRCRLLRRGFAVEPPNGESFCDTDMIYDYKEL